MKRLIKSFLILQSIFLFLGANGLYAKTSANVGLSESHHIFNSKHAASAVSHCTLSSDRHHDNGSKSKEIYGDVAEEDREDEEEKQKLLQLKSIHFIASAVLVINNHYFSRGAHLPLEQQSFSPAHVRKAFVVFEVFRL